jgi:purine nucleosidase
MRSTCRAFWKQAAGYNPGMSWKWLALVLLAGLTALAQGRAPARIPIILDTDIGDSIDDALALAFALRSPELDVRAVTTVIDDVDSKTRLAWKMLSIYNRRDIALATGASEPLLDPTLAATSKEFEVLTRNDVIPDAARRRAADLIIDTVLESRGKITIVAIGPMTNIALAIKTDPRIKNNIERIVMMAGAYLSSESEYNVKRDRTAAEIVFHSGVPITAVGLDVTAQCKLQEKDLDRMRLADDPAGNFLIRLVDLAAEQTHDANPTLYDPLAIAAIFRPDLLVMQGGTVDVPPSGSGQTIFKPASGSKTEVAVKVNVPAFLELFVDRVTGGSGGPRQ